MTRIPLPGNGGDALQRGVESGTGMFANLLGQGVNLGRMHQQGQQFDKTQQFNEKQLAQTWQQHLQDIAMRQKVESRLAALQPWQLKLLEAQVGQANANTQGLQFDQDLITKLLNGQMGGQGAQQPQAPAQPFSMGQGMASNFNPFGGQDMQQPAPPSMETVQNGFSNMNPALAGLVKKRTGIDPYAESPDQKAARELNEFGKKEDLKAKNKEKLDRTTITEPVRTQAQKTLIAAKSTLGLLDELIKEDVPGSIGGKFTPDQKAIADALSGLTADDLMTIFSLPKDKHSTEIVEQMTKKQFLESDPSYKKRLKQLKARINKKVGEMNGLLNSGNVSEHEENSSSGKLTYNPLTGRVE